ncbi:hypothetical protein CTAYLR_005516 [Chrysophaeum taylorii]|uniref:Fe2OG dioxygenase domain-containing protein n=1 Tax=Chrysophaeum taylorii TaxID=2483200 RepID=A0AAD7U6Y1_9STRA|nr:hypothetical protein CTAYLR_005516 [Chrysophaeum taylorii]
MACAELAIAVIGCDEEAALRLIHTDVTHVDRRSGYSLLHHAAQFGLTKVVEALVSRLPVEATTVDLVLQGHVVQAGGQTPLHLAAANGHSATVDVLVGAGADRLFRDWDGLTAGDLALAQGYEAIASRLKGKPHDPTLVAAKRKTRAAALLAVPDHLRTAYVLPLLSLDECDRVVAAVVSTAAAKDGWSTDRHVNYATTDLASSACPLVDAWLRNLVKIRIFPTLYRNHRASIIEFRDLFFVQYSATSQNSLDLHRDATPLSFNVLLNSPHHFEGGGTFIEADARTYHIPQGHCLVHSGKLRHAANPVTFGSRLVLVAFLDIENKSGGH